MKKLCIAGLGMIAMSAAPVFAQTEAAATPAAPATQQEQASGGAAEGCAAGSANRSFSERFASSYKDYLAWNGDPADAAPTWREGYAPPPESSPPFPFTAWPIGGTEVIGYDNQYYGPLMEALWCGANGKAWKDSRVTVYGWANAGFNRSTSHTGYNGANGTGGNFPAAYAYQGNTAQMDQVALYVERTPDVVQKDHFDWGFRLAGVWGTDTKYTFSRGLFSNQFSNANNKIQKYGYDIPMAYIEGYFPGVADGMILRVGRYISIPDIEAQLAPNNYTYTHSLLYTYDPFTQEGAIATIRLNKNWTVQAGVHAGNDVAPWYRRSVPATYTNAAGVEVPNPNAGKQYGAQLSGTACVQWTSDSGNDAIYPCMNGINSGNFGWNNLQQQVVTWYHKFNDQWHMSSEAYYMQQKNTPNMSNPDGPGVWNSYFGSSNSVGGPFGAMGGRGCGPNDGVTCTSKEWAFVNYISYQPTPRDYFIFRTDILNDINGQRTGFATRYKEFTLSWNHWLGKAITLRPEIRHESAGVPAFDNPCPVAGTAGCGNVVTPGSKSQTMFAMDVIVHF